MPSCVVLAGVLACLLAWVPLVSSCLAGARAVLARSVGPALGSLLPHVLFRHATGAAGLTAVIERIGWLTLLGA
jgi:hypothetical protein